MTRARIRFPVHNEDSVRFGRVTIRQGLPVSDVSFVLFNLRLTRFDLIRYPLDNEDAGAHDISLSRRRVRHPPLIGAESYLRRAYRSLPAVSFKSPAGCRPTIDRLTVCRTSEVTLGFLSCVFYSCFESHLLSQPVGDCYSANKARATAMTRCQQL